LIPLVGKIRGGNTGEISQEWELSHTTYKVMTPPLTQNLKALGLRVFFLICCSTFSFLPNVGLRLTLEYLTISPSSVSPSTLLMTPHLYRRSHTYMGHACLKSSSEKDFRYRVKLYSPRPQTNVGRIRGGNTGEISQEWERTEPHHI